MNAHTTEPDLEIPPLSDGQRLLADEFHRRYLSMPFVKNAQLIDGVVHMSSQVYLDQHGGPHSDIIFWLGYFRSFCPQVRVADNTSLRIDDENEPQPDAMLLLDPTHCGGTWTESRLLRGTPELIVEIAASSARLDAGEKRDLYQRIGVREYILWRVLDARIDWWHLADGKYQILPQDDKGVNRSRVFPGLWLNTPAMLAGRLDLVKNTVDAGLQCQEYLDFAEKLREEKSGI